MEAHLNYFDEKLITHQGKQKTAIELIPRDEDSLKEKILELNNINYDIINLPHLTPKQN
jgi:hypothetical protein